MLLLHHMNTTTSLLTNPCWVTRKMPSCHSPFKTKCKSWMSCAMSAYYELKHCCACIWWRLAGRGYCFVFHFICFNVGMVPFSAGSNSFWALAYALPISKYNSDDHLTHFSYFNVSMSLGFFSHLPHIMRSKSYLSSWNKIIMAK